MTNLLAEKEAYRDAFFLNKDPIRTDRLFWRAQSFRHLVHLLPGQTILEIGCGDGSFTRQLQKVSRGQNQIVAVTFNDREKSARNLEGLENVTLVWAADFPNCIRDLSFDFVVATNLFDEKNGSWLLQIIFEFLKPSGQFVAYESNPWNPFLKLRRLLNGLRNTADNRRLLNQPKLYELISEIGFIRIFAVFNDFVYAPLTPFMIWLLRNFSILLENAPLIRTAAGAILIHAQKPPKKTSLHSVSLAQHKSLKNSISVVIPCHNEEMNIGGLIDRLRELYDDYLFEIIPVDDNSKDNTRKVIETMMKGDPRIKPVFRNPPNGVGLAIADGFRKATGRYILSMDCDFKHLLPEFRDLFDAADAGFDLVTGSRFSRHSVLLNYPFLKILANRGFHALACLMLLRDFRDLTNNLKLIRREVASNIIFDQPGFAVNAETGLQPLMMGCKIKEVPISWINRDPDMGVSSFRLAKVGAGYWKVLLNLWLGQFLRIGPYKKLPKMGSYRKTNRLVQ